MCLETAAHSVGAKGTSLEQRKLHFLQPLQGLKLSFVVTAR